jgi:hypothetical protein
MRDVSRWLAAVVLACVVMVVIGIVASGQSAKPKAPADPPVAMDSMVLKDFQQRLEHYIKFQRGIEKDIGAKQKPVDDPQVINRKEETLAGTIRANRRNAKQGDIFSPQIANEFRRLMNPELKGRRGSEVKEELTEDFGEEADEGKPKPVPLKVNASYPEGNPLPTVPATLLAALPTLPPDVEYRIIGRNLILRDVDANIIVDFIPRAIR